MKTYEKKFKQDQLFEMSNLTNDDTGLPFIIWIAPMSGKERHWARVKVEKDGNLYPMSISDNPEWKMKKNVQNPFSGRETKLIQTFIKNNKNLLLSYWESGGTMSMRVVLDNLEKIR